VIGFTLGRGKSQLKASQLRQAFTVNAHQAAIVYPPRQLLAKYTTSSLHSTRHDSIREALLSDKFIAATAPNRCSSVVGVALRHKSFMVFLYG